MNTETALAQGATPMAVACQTVLMPEDEARAAVVAICRHFEGARQLLLDLYEREGWRALGYDSWRACVIAEFGHSQAHLYRLLEAARLERDFSPIGENLQPVPESRLRVVASAPAEIRAELFAHARDLPTRELRAIRRELEAEIIKRRPAAAAPRPITPDQHLDALAPDDQIAVALAEHLPWADGSIDLGITSPPYCLGDAVPYADGGDYADYEHYRQVVVPAWCAELYRVSNAAHGRWCVDVPVDAAGNAGDEGQPIQPRAMYAHWLAALEAAGFAYRTTILWHKGQAGTGTDRGTYEAAGGLLQLAELNVATPTAAHITFYARIVADHALRRRYIGAAQHVAELAWDVRRDVDLVRQRSEALILGATTDTLSGQVVLSPPEWTGHLMDYLERSRTGGLAGVSTGLRDLDTMTLGLSPGLYLLAASTGTGKTALAGQIALHVAERHGPVVFVSMELTDVDLGVRLVSVVTNIKKEKLVLGDLSDGQQYEVLNAVERLEKSKLYIVYGSGYTTGDVRAHLLRAQAAEGARPALLVVDYVQLLGDEEGDGRSRERNVSAAAKGLKKLSGELEVPVLALVQLNRNRAGRSDKHPTLTDLRESGDLENTADSVIGLYREEMDHPETMEKKLAELIVLKKRQLGDDVGTIRRLVWVGESYKDFAYQ